MTDEPQTPRRRGRPRLLAEERTVKINITLSPGALAILDARGAGRSQEIERLIHQSEDQKS